MRPSLALALALSVAAVASPLDAREPKPKAATVTKPGFELTAEGGSRFFVGLSGPVQVEEKRAKGAITYVLKGARVRVQNNRNALVTVHFNTPATRARLVPHGGDLHFVIDLRADVAPTWKLGGGEEDTTVLRVDFPKGAYLPQGEDAGDAAP